METETVSQIHRQFVQKDGNFGNMNVILLHMFVVMVVLVLGGILSIAHMVRMKMEIAFRGG
jgi:hypothetical protein